MRWEYHGISGSNHSNHREMFIARHLARYAIGLITFFATNTKLKVLSTCVNGCGWDDSHLGSKHKVG